MSLDTAQVLLSVMGFVAILIAVMLKKGDPKHADMKSTAMIVCLATGLVGCLGALSIMTGIVS